MSFAASTSNPNDPVIIKALSLDQEGLEMRLEVFGTELTFLSTPAEERVYMIDFSKSQNLPADNAERITSVEKLKKIADRHNYAVDPFHLQGSHNLQSDRKKIILALMIMEHVAKTYDKEGTTNITLQFGVGTKNHQTVLETFFSEYSRCIPEKFSIEVHNVTLRKSTYKQFFGIRKNQPDTERLAAQLRKILPKDILTTELNSAQIRACVAAVLPAEEQPSILRKLWGFKKAQITPSASSSQHNSPNITASASRATSRPPSVAPSQCDSPGIATLFSRSPLPLPSATSTQHNSPDVTAPASRVSSPLPSSSSTQHDSLGIAEPASSSYSPRLFSRGANSHDATAVNAAPPTHPANPRPFVLLPIAEEQGRRRSDSAPGRFSDSEPQETLV